MPLSLGSIVFLFVLAASIEARDYTNTTTLSSKYIVHWSVEDGVFYLKLDVETTG